MRLTSTLAVSLLFTAASLGFAQHRLITQGNDKLAIVGQDGKIEWEMKWGGIHDIHVLPLKRFGNRIPQISAELCRCDGASAVTVTR